MSRRSPQHSRSAQPQRRNVVSKTQQNQRMARWRKRFPKFALSRWWDRRIVESLGEAFRASIEAARAVVGATGSQTVGLAYGRPLRVEGLESRVLLAADVFVDDDWAGLANGDMVDHGMGGMAEIGVDAFATIQAGIAAADPAGNVNVAGGSYSGALAIGKDLTLAAYDNPNFADLDDVDVDAGGAFAGVQISAGFSSSISGFDFTGFAGTGIDAEGDLVLADSTITGGFTGLSVDGSTTQVSGTVISGASIFGVEVTAAGDLVATASEFTGNSTAGVIVSNGVANVSGSIISGNGRGLIVAAAGSATISGSNLDGNTGDAVENASAVAVNASGNWWGSSAELHVQNASTGLVDFTPYLNSGADSDGGAVGFAGDTSTLNVTTLGEQTAATGRIQEGIDSVAAMGTVNVNAGTYDETVSVNKSATLQSLSPLGATIAPTSGSQQTVVSIDANDVTIDGFVVQVNQTDNGSGAPIAPVGISNIPTSGSNGSFDGLVLSNNSVTSVGDSPANWSNSPSLSVRGAGIVLHGPTSPTGVLESVDITGSMVDITSGSSFFQRGIWLAEMNADVTGNTIAGASNDLIFQFASGGASLIDNNDFVGQHRGGGAGLNISDPNANSPITISNNDFLPSGDDPASFETSLQINRSVNGNNGSPIEIVSNTFDGHVIGISAGNADGLTIDDNQFTPGENLVSQPLLGGADFIHIAVDSQSASNNGSTGISIEADVKNNTFNSATGSQGTGITIADNLAGSSFGAIDIGVNGANSYDADLVTGVAITGGAATVTETISNLDTAVNITGGTASIVGSTISQNNVGVRVQGGAALQMTGGSVDNNVSNGLLTLGDGSFQSVAVDGTSFSGNATGQPVSAGHGDITLFEFAGPAGTPSTATFKNVTITSDNPDYAIQVRGRNGDLATDGLMLNPGSTADVSFNNVDILGTQQRFGVLLQQYADLSTFSFDDVTFDSVAQGGLVIFDAAGALDLGNTTFHDTYTAGDGVGDGTGLDLATSLNSTDATNVTFLDVSDVPLDNTTLAGNFAIEDRVGHAVDAEATPAVAGFVDWIGAGNPFDDGVFLTPESFAPPFSTSAQVQRAIDVADVVTAKDTVYIQTGVYTDDAQVVIDNDVTVIGEGKGATILNPGFDTGTAGNSRGWWLVDAGVNLDLSELTMDGSGQLVWQGIRHLGTGTIDNVSFENIQFNASGPHYQGTAVAAFGGVGPVDVTNSMFSDIGRIGVLYFGAGTTGTFDGNTYTGKGAGDFLDYALDISAGANIDVSNNTISGNMGVASSDGSASAGILVSTFFAPGTTATLTGNNVISGNSTGVFVGFNASDASDLTIDGGQITGNDTGVLVRGVGAEALIQSADLTGNTTGLRILEDATVDAGGGATSLGTSTGGNTFTGYDGVTTLAIDNGNLDAGGNVDVFALNNDFGSSVTAVIEQVIDHTVDDALLTEVFFSQAPVIPPASPVFVNDDWVGVATGVDADGAGTNGSSFGADQFATISDAVAAVQVGGQIIVLNGDYDETFVIGKALTLSTDDDPDNLAQTEAVLTSSVGSNDKVLIEVTADDVTIDGFHLIVDRDHASGGIAASNVAQPDVNLSGGSFNNLTIANNLIESSGENIGSFDLVGGLNSSAMGIALIGSGGPVHSVTVTGNQVLGTDGTATIVPIINPTGFSGFTRGLYLGQVQADVTGNTLEGFAQDLLNQFASGGTTSITGNTFHLAGVDISSPNAASPIDLSGNNFDIQTEVFPQSLLIRAHHDASSLVTVSGNTFTGHTTGIVVDNSSAVVIDDNDFTAAAAAVDAENIVLDTDKFGSLANTTPVGATITNNEFFGTGTGITLRDGNPGAAVAPAFAGVLLGGDGSENTFNSSLGAYISLDPNGAGGPVSVDLDASENIFGVTSGDLEPSAMSLDDLFELEDKILHTIDVASLGLVTVVAGQVFVTTNSFDGVNTLTPSIQRGIDAAAAGDRVNVSAGTFIENLTIGKDVEVVGQTDGGGVASTNLNAASGGDLVQLAGSGFGDDESVLIENFNFDGLSGLAGFGVRVISSADFNGLSIDNGSFTGFGNNAVGVFGDAITGLSVQDVSLNNLSFTNNGINGGGGSGSVQFFLYNGDASLSNLTLVGNRDEGMASGARTGIQFRGVGAGDGTSELPIGTVSLDNVDVSGRYRTQMIGIQRYSDVDNLSFNDVKLGGAGSEITGGFGASLRFDAVGSGTSATPATFDLGNTEFRGLDASSAQRHEIEFAPDNAFAFLRVDGTDTTWSGVAAADLTLAEAFDVEDRILHFVDKLNPTHGVNFGAYKGFVDIQVDQAFITDAADAGVVGDGSIQRGIDIVNSGGTVNVSAGTFSEGSQIVVDKDVNVVGQGKGVTVLTPGFDTGSGGDARGWWLVEATGDLDISNMTFDGTGNLVFQAFRHKGVGSFDNVAFDDIQFNASGPNYAGTAIAAFGGIGAVDVSNSMFSDIGRVGVLYFGAGTTGTFDNNMYTGKGTGDFLDYALDISSGAVVDVTNNVISGNEGVASVDGSTSAGILVSTFFGGGTTANLSDNNISGNTTGVFIGFNNADTSTVSIDGDTITGNTGSGVLIIGATATIANDAEITGNATGITVSDSGSATIINNDNSITGNTIGIDVDGGTALIENNDLNNNTIGVLVQDGSVADLGDSSGADITGLGTGTGAGGSSAGLNDFSSYTAAATSTSGAVVILNDDAGLVGPQGIGSGDIPAFGNTWDNPSAAGIENVVWHDADDNNLAFLDFAGLANLQLTLDQDPVDEGETADALTLDGSFTNDSQAHTVTIDWGDGTANSVINLAQGVFVFSADHTYADNDAYTVTVTVEEDATSIQVSDTATANVANVAPTLTVVGNQTVDEGSALSIPDIGTLTDPGFDTETFDFFIDWGDGSTADTGSATIDVPGAIGSATEASFDGSHTFADDGLYTVTVRVADDDMTGDFLAGVAGVDFVEQTFEVTVANVAPSLTVVGNQTVDEGSALSIPDIGTLTDPGFDTETFDFFIDWGDGSTADTGSATIDAPGAIGSATEASFDGSHTFADDGLYTVTVRVADDDMTGDFLAGVAGVDFVEQTFEVTVANVAPSLTVVGNQTVDEGSALSIPDIGTLTDPGFDTETFDFFIDWGDGSTADTGSATIDVPGAIGSATEASFDGSHTFADDGLYTVTVRVADDDMTGDFLAGVAGVDFVEQTFEVTVANVAPTVVVSGDSNVDEGSVYTLDLGAITDPGDDVISGYIIEWGDGDSDNFAGSPENQSHTHTYDDGTLIEDIRITLIDDDGPHMNAGVPDPFSVTVDNVAPTATFFNTGAVPEGTSGVVAFAGQNDPSTADTNAGFHYAYDFDNDGAFEIGDGTFAGSVMSATASVPASFLDDGPGTRTVRGRIIDKDGGFSEFTTDITINNVVPTFDAGADATVAAGVPFTRTLMFTDPGSEALPPAGWIITVDYGDGSGPQGPASFTPATRTFSLEHTYASTGMFTVTVQIDDQDGVVASDTFEVTVFQPTFQVANFTPDVSGFTVQFNRAADLGPINIYDGLNNLAPAHGPSDVIVTSGGQVVPGSIDWDAATNSIVFVKTGGVLVDGAYDVTLRSAADALQDTLGELLDGDGNGTAGDNFTTSFVVSSAGERVVSLPDFARGAGQDVNLPPAADGGLDIPVSIDDAAGVTAVDFDVVYDPSLLTITGATLGSGPAGSVGWTITTNGTTPGVFKVSLSGTSALTGADLELIKLDAEVPNSAPYGDNQVIRLANLEVNEDQIASKSDAAVHKAVFLGDADGDGTYLGFDAALISRVVVDLDSGFHAHRWTDPVIVADATRNGALSGQDASLVAQEAVLIDTDEIPPLGAGPLVAPLAGVDPQLMIDSNIVAVRGSGVTVPVDLDVLPSESVISSTFDVFYDSSVLDFLSADFGGSWTMADGWNLVANEPTSGRVRVAVFNSDPSASGIQEIANLEFAASDSTNLGDTSPLDVEPASPTEGGLIWTESDGSVVFTDLPGDYNRDGVVSSIDYAVWRENLGNSVPNFSGADGNGDGIVDSQDYDVWKSNFGNSFVPVSGTFAIATPVVAPISTPAGEAQAAIAQSADFETAALSESNDQLDAFAQLGVSAESAEKKPVRNAAEDLGPQDESELLLLLESALAEMTESNDADDSDFSGTNDREQDQDAEVSLDLAFGQLEDF